MGKETKMCHYKVLTNTIPAIAMTALPRILLFVAVQDISTGEREDSGKGIQVLNVHRIAMFSDFKLFKY